MNRLSFVLRLFFDSFTLTSTLRPHSVHSDSSLQFLEMRLSRQTLQHTHNSQHSSRRLISFLEVLCSGAEKESGEQRDEGFVEDVENGGNGVFVVEDG